MPHVIQSKKAAKRRRRISAAQSRLHAAVEKQFEKVVRSWLNGVKRDVLARLEAFGTTQITAEDLFLLVNHGRAFSAKLLPKWNLAAWSGVQFEAEWIGSQEAKQSLAMVRQELELPPDFDPPPSINVDPSPGLMRSVNGFLKERQVGVWRSVTGTTHGVLNRVIRKGLEEGDTLDQMTGRIRKTLTNYTDYEARRVARTETTGAMNHGGQAERTDLGIESKEWVSTIDIRNRGATPGGFDLPGPDVLRFRGSRDDHQLWQKERLINLALECTTADAVAWIDADLYFCNPRWIAEARERLTHARAVQLFAHVADTDAKGNVGDRRPGHAKNRINQIPVWGRPGGAWIALRDDLPAGLYDRHIIGGVNAAAAARAAAALKANAVKKGLDPETGFERKKP